MLPLLGKKPWSLLTSWQHHESQRPIGKQPWTALLPLKDIIFLTPTSQDGILMLFGRKHTPQQEAEMMVHNKTCHSVPWWPKTWVSWGDEVLFLTTWFATVEGLGCETFATKMDGEKNKWKNGSSKWKRESFEPNRHDFPVFFGGLEPDVCKLALFEDQRLSEISPWVVGFLAATSSVLVLEQEIANLNQFWKNPRKKTRCFFCYYFHSKQTSQLFKCVFCGFRKPLMRNCRRPIQQRRPLANCTMKSIIPVQVRRTLGLFAWWAIGGERVQER